MPGEQDLVVAVRPPVRSMIVLRGIRHPSNTARDETQRVRRIDRTAVHDVGELEHRLRG